jgi:hypothetical protein
MTVDARDGARKDVMFLRDTELFYPARLTPQLSALRGPTWRRLVERVARLPDSHPDQLAFSLLMIRLDGCLACRTDSFRALRGCWPCSQSALGRFKGTDRELLALYAQARKEVQAFLARRSGPRETVA